MEQAKKIILTTITERTGLLGRKQRTEEALVLFYEGGKVILRQSAVEDAGDSWSLFLRRIQEKAKNAQVPFHSLLK